MDLFSNCISCPSCGKELSKGKICLNSDCEVVGYSFGTDLESQLNNNMWTANKAVEKMNLKHAPVFHVLGGVALHYHGLNYHYTLDIDTANSIDESVKKEINGMLDDNASEVALLAKNYENRLVRIKEELSNIEVWILGVEDLFISKLTTRRTKDLRALKTTGIRETINKDLLFKIINEELDEKEKIECLRMCEQLF